METQAPVREEHRESNLLLPLALVVLVLVVAYFLYTSSSEALPRESTLATGAGEVVYTDLSLNSPTRLPSGFPLNIPVEQAGVQESYKVLYADMGATQYTVAYVSSLSRADIWQAYTGLLSILGYPPGSVELDEERGVIRAESNGDKLHIALSPYGSSQYVTINYIERD